MDVLEFFTDSSRFPFCVFVNKKPRPFATSLQGEFSNEVTHMDGKFIEGSDTDEFIYILMLIYHFIDYSWLHLRARALSDVACS